MSTPLPSDGPEVHILTVCTGNVCRSPYAAAVLADRLERVRPGAFAVRSAGVHALVDEHVDPGVGRLLARKGIDVAGFRARQVTPRRLGKADLVLVMTEDHLREVLDENPAAHRTTFALRSFADALVDIGRPEHWAALLADVGADEVGARWRALPGLLADHRRPSRRRRAVEGVTDPRGRSAEAFEEMADQIDTAVATIVDWEASFPR